MYLDRYSWHVSIIFERGVDECTYVRVVLRVCVRERARERVNGEDFDVSEK